jgi:serine/threonine protein kinase/tetratricopeptide (TPR) repeat protein
MPADTSDERSRQNAPDDVTQIDPASHLDDATLVVHTFGEQPASELVVTQAEVTQAETMESANASLDRSPAEDDGATLVDPATRAGATRLQSTEPRSEDATMLESDQGGGASPSALPTLIDPSLPPEASRTNTGYSASAGTSSVARAWAPTKGATGAAWPGKPPLDSTRQAPRHAPRAEDRYRLIDNFAHGGLGNIWLAEDTVIHRQVAFKELLPKALKNRVVVERFLEEAQITGQLEHPGIVPIYDVGYQENGTPFYAMKLVRGRNMEDAIEEMHRLPRDSSERQLAFTRLLRQFIAVCQAVGFAHEKGVLHRDLKPLNVMLGEFGETLVLDWGLAKVLDLIQQAEQGREINSPHSHATSDAAQEEITESESATIPAPEDATAIVSPREIANAAASQSLASLVDGTQAGQSQTGTTYRRLVTTDARTAGSDTVMGQVMGTLAYMPPEQALGKIDELDPRTDIYSLGGILYKLLTNLPPVPRGKPPEVLAKVVAGDIRPPRSIDPAIPPALEAICRKAMAKSQADRYAKATALAADVEAWLADEPVSVYPDPLPTKLRRWAKRHRTFVYSTVAALGVLVVGSVAWKVIEGRRIEGLRNAAQSKIVEAQTATAQSDFSKANLLLTEALGLVRSDAELATLRDRLQSDLDNVARLQSAAERERLANLRRKAEQLLDDADQAEAANNLAQARTLLTETVTLLASETSLGDLHRDAKARLDRVTSSLAQQAERIAAQQQLAKFEAAVEQVRVFGGNVSGEDSIDDLREAQRHGLAALKLFAFDFDRPEEFDPRLKLLGPEAIETWRTGLLELLVTIAQAETNLALKDQPQDVVAAAQRSLDYLRQAETLGLKSRPAMLLKADLLATIGQAEAATRTLEIAEQMPARTRLDHYWLAERARRQHNFAQAIRHLQDALRVDPDDFWSLNLMGICHLNQGQPAAAAANFTACIARRPNLVWPYLSRAIAFADLEQFENAHLDLNRALEISPNAYPVHLNRGFVFLLQKKFDEAKQDFATAAELRPDLAAPHLNFAETCSRQADELVLTNAPDGVVRAAAELQTALVELTKALPLAPQQAAIYHLRGTIQIKLNAPAAALSDFQRAVQLEPSPLRRAASFREIGFIHQRANRLPEALAAFDESLQHNPQDTNVIRQRAEVLLALRRYEDAIAGFTSFLEKAGPVGDVYRARGLAYKELNRYREAINDYTMSLQFEPSPNMLAQRGKAYLLHASQLAKEDLELALRLNPENPDTHHFLAYAMVQLGDHAGAAATIDQATDATRNAVKKLGPRAWPLCFNPATTFAQATLKAQVDPALSPEQREQLVSQYSRKAVGWLVEARQVAGNQFETAFVETLRNDTALDPIRQHPEFRAAFPALDAKLK